MSRCISMTVLCMDTEVNPSADAACRTRRAGPLTETLSGRVAGIVCRMDPAVHLPFVGSARQPAGATGPDRPWSERGTQHSAGKVGPSNATGGSHGEYSRFPAVVLTRNITGPQTVKYSTRGWREEGQAASPRNSHTATVSPPGPKRGLGSLQGHLPCTPG